MHNRYIMTAFGVDRVGFVTDVTRLLYENDCNLEDTTMGMLVDEFTLSLLFSSSDPDIEEKLARECRRLELEKGISAFVRQLPRRERNNTAGTRVVNLHIEGLDQAGIVYKTSQFLTNNDLNIVQLDSTASPSPQSGATLYSMNLQVELPLELNPGRFEEDLSHVADELQVDITLS